MVKRSLVLLVLLHAVGVSYGQGTYSDANRDLFTLPVSASLAGSDIAFARNAAPTSSPANLTLEKNSRIDLFYSSKFDLYSTSLLSLIQQIDSQTTAGISISYLLVPNIPDNTAFETNTTGDPIYDESKIKYESASDVYGRLVFCRTLLSTPFYKIAAGVAGNVERTRLLQGIVGYSIGLDAGAAAQFPTLGLNANATFWNVSTRNTHWGASYNERSAPRATIGLGWADDIEYVYGRIQISYRTLDFFTGNEVNSGDGTIFFGNQDSGTAADDPVVIHPSTHPLEFIVNGFYGIEYKGRPLWNTATQQNTFHLESIAVRVGLAGARQLSCGVGLMFRLPAQNSIGFDLGTAFSPFRFRDTKATSTGLPDVYFLSLAGVW